MKAAMCVVPPGGGGAWHYDQPWNEKTLPFDADTRDNLEAKIRSFRIQNELDATTVKSDLDAFYAKQKAPVRREPQSLRERVTQWIANRKFSQNEFVDDEVAEARARLVAACPYNQTSWADSCTECTAKTVADSLAVRKGKTTSVDSTIGACTYLGWDNKTAVHLGIKSLRSIVQYPDAPPDCCCKKWAITNDKP